MMFGTPWCIVYGKHRSSDLLYGRLCSGIEQLSLLNSGISGRSKSRPPGRNPPRENRQTNQRPKVDEVCVFLGKRIAETDRYRSRGGSAEQRKEPRRDHGFDCTTSLAHLTHSVSQTPRVALNHFPSSPKRIARPPYLVSHNPNPNPHTPLLGHRDPPVPRTLHILVPRLPQLQDPNIALCPTLLGPIPRKQMRNRQHHLHHR
jgi:hypothetical protein